MFRSYMTVIALACLAATIGCTSSDSPPSGGGTGGDAGSGGSAGSGGEGGSGPSASAVTGFVDLGCANSQTADVSILSWEQTVDPGAPVEPGAEFTADLTGTAFFASSFLDGVLNVLPDIDRIEITQLAATVQVRSGATGDGVTLGAGDIPYSCEQLDGSGAEVPCDPANDAEDGSNSDCEPVIPGNGCGQFLFLPTSLDCSVGGECDGLGKADTGSCRDTTTTACQTAADCPGSETCIPDGGLPGDVPGSQCNRSGFCITSDLPLPLETKSGTYTADADASEILFGWDETNTGAEAVEVFACSVGGETCDPANGNDDCTEGTCDSAGMLWDLPDISGLAMEIGPNGVTISALISAGLACTMGVDSAEVTPISDLSSPSPDSELLHLQLGTMCAEVDCGDDNECTHDLCDPADGSCSNDSWRDGLSCDFDGEGAPGVCNAGACENAMLCEGVVCTSDTVCRADGTCDDADGSCIPGAAATLDTDCTGDGGAGVFCDDAGSCVECNSADQCTEDANECTAAACTGNACGQANVANDTPCADDVGVCTDGTCVLPECIVNGDCDDLNECTINTCDTGSCASTPDVGAACTVASIDGTCDDAGMCITDVCMGVDCGDGNDCTADNCSPVDGSCSNPDENDGTVCNGGAGRCMTGACEPLVDPGKVTAVLTVGCTNNITGDISILPFALSVDPAGIGAGETVPVTLGGVAEFSETFLDAAQGAVPGGVTEADLVNLAATVLIRTGGSLPDNTTLTNGPIPTTCLIDDTSCDQANDQASVPGMRPNTDCTPTGTFNPCQANVTLPTSSDCSVDGVCDLLGKKVSQCDLNGFCVTGGLPLDLADLDTNFQASASPGTVTFGWDDVNTGALPLNGDGTYNLPAAVFTNPPTPNEIKVNASGLSVALRCTMAVDSGGADGVGVPDQASPTPTDLLIDFTIQ
jgi:hypothetical protein